MAKEQYKDKLLAQDEGMPYPLFYYPEYTSQKNLSPPLYTDGQHYGGPPTTTNSTVVVQPVSTTTRYVEEPIPPSHIGLAIFSCICCCPLIGIIAIVFAASVSDAVDRGDMEEARSKSNATRNLSIAAIAVGAVCGVIFILRSYLPSRYD